MSDGPESIFSALKEFSVFMEEKSVLRETLSEWLHGSDPKSYRGFWEGAVLFSQPWEGWIMDGLGVGSEELFLVFKHTGSYNQSPLLWIFLYLKETSS